MSDDRLQVVLHRRHIDQLAAAARAQAMALDAEAANSLNVAAGALQTGGVPVSEVRGEQQVRAIAALKTLASAIRRNPGTGQVRRLVAFLGGLYNGPRFPFDLTELRGLDANLAEACLEVLAFDRLAIAEIHTWGVFDAAELNQWLVGNGEYYRAQARRIGRELYEIKFGSKGHPDEGLAG